MPNLFRVGGYLVFFGSNENGEPIHVHIIKGKPSPSATKVWLTSSGQCIVANNRSRIPQNDLNELLDIISAQFFLICRKCKEHFCVDKYSSFADCQQIQNFRDEADQSCSASSRFLEEKHDEEIF